jgi:hypothetical protein
MKLIALGPAGSFIGLSLFSVFILRVDIISPKPSPCIGGKERYLV